MSSIGHVTSPDGTRIGYERDGSGPPLVLVHGTSADRTRWEPVLAGLQARFTVYAVDRRGRGLSGDNAPYALEREFEDIVAVVDAINEPVALLGHSFGALCALEAAVRTRRVGRLILYEPGFKTEPPPYEPGQRERLEALLAAGDRESALVAFFREIVAVSEEQLDMLRTAPSWPGRLAAVHTIPREFADGDYIFEPRRFERLAIPVLLLAGSESPRSLQAATTAVHAALPTSRLTAMGGQAHIAMTTAPELFTHLVLEFLAP